MIICVYSVAQVTMLLYQFWEMWPDFPCQHCHGGRNSTYFKMFCVVTFQNKYLETFCCTFLPFIPVCFSTFSFFYFSTCLLFFVLYFLNNIKVIFDHPQPRITNTNYTKTMIKSNNLSTVSSFFTNNMMVFWGHKTLVQHKIWKSPKNNLGELFRKVTTDV